jgi:3-isopropylmalate/(R)-2-methylmalate dehydratase small subunit
VIRGRAWKYGKNIDTDGIYPAKYLVYFAPEEVAKHAMEDVDPGFLKKIKPGDIIIAESNFGAGSAREQAAMALKFAQIGAVVADSFNRCFYRNAVNNALPVVPLKGISKLINEGDDVEIDLEKGLIIDHTSVRQWSAAPMPGLLLDIIAAGGAVPYYRMRNLEGRLKNT